MIIEKYSLTDIGRIKEHWQFLDKGSDMTYFQSYDWNEMLTKTVRYHQKWIETCFILVSGDNGSPLLIAPLVIYKRNHLHYNKKGVYFYGRQGWSDYLNFIYSDLKSEVVDCLLDYLKNRYDIAFFSLEQLKEDSSLYKYLKNTKTIISEGTTTCVNLTLPETITDYTMILSKHTRQNIRTAYNRLKKNNLDITYVDDDHHVDLDRCQELRAKRVIQKNGKFHNNFTLLQKLKYKLWEKTFVQAPPYLPFKSDPNRKMMTVYIQNNLCAFFNYGYDAIRKEIVVMAVGLDERYAKYSPGLLLMHDYICTQIERKDIVRVDFTRGNESYKYSLGGKDFFVHNLEFTI